MLGPMSIGALSSGAAAEGFTGAYDDIPNLVHVYEIARRTLTSYTGNLVRLRRGSDDAELDFSYTANGDLDTAAITTWLGGASGFVVTVYDQVNGDDVTQATPANQPLYVASGQGSRAVMRLDGSNHYLQGAFTNGGLIAQPCSVYAAAQVATAAASDGASHFLLDGDDSTNRVALFKRNTETWAFFAGILRAGGAANDNWNIWAALANGASSELWHNGTSVVSGDIGAGAPDALTIGASQSIGELDKWQGDIAPVVFTEPAHSTAQRQAMETAINDYYSIF